MRRNVSNLARLAVREFLPRRIDKIVKLSRLVIGFDLTVSAFVLELMEPVTKLGEPVVRQLTNPRFKLFDFTHCMTPQIGG